MGQAGKVVYETLKDIGDAAKEIVNDGRAEGKVGSLLFLSELNIVIVPYC